MTRLFLLLTASAVLALSVAGHCPAEELSPEAIISRSWELFRQVPDEKETVKIVVAYKDGR
ncbi:MAG: hypothetical protein HGB17_03340, partial [Syntrophobacteraceae bacterium]|nr:hypothetical protein [Syntrophobacteraceae bacterium]